LRLFALETTGKTATSETIKLKPQTTQSRALVRGGDTRIIQTLEEMTEFVLGGSEESG
jgi:hypothetical protein